MSLCSDEIYVGEIVTANYTPNPPTTVTHMLKKNAQKNIYVPQIL